MNPKWVLVIAPCVLIVLHAINFAYQEWKARQGRREQEQMSEFKRARLRRRGNKRG